MRTLMLGIAACAALLAGCKTGSATREVPLAVSSRVPAAQGTVTLKPQEHGNNELEIRVSHLAQPAQVTPRADAYVVWLQPLAGQQRSAPMNVGALSPGQDLSATFKTKTPYSQFNVFVTPEPNERAVKPTTRPLLSASILRGK